MAYQVRKYKIIGESALIPHNGQLANPLNQFSRDLKKISGKRDKTEADFEEMARLEWFGSLYLDNGCPCIPSEVLEATFLSGAKKKKRGVQAKAGMFCDKNFPLVYNGSNGEKPDLQKMWESEEYRFSVPVVVQRSRVIRTRPRFNAWSALVEIHFDDKLLNPGEILDIMKIAGEQVGLCDWRPKFGRFTVQEIKE